MTIIDCVETFTQHVVWSLRDGHESSGGLVCRRSKIHLDETPLEGFKSIENDSASFICVDGSGGVLGEVSPIRSARS